MQPVRQAVGAGTKDTSGKIVAPGLDLPQRLPMMNARHHWAVRQLRAGTPGTVVQHQLGRATAKLTLDTCGHFLPDAADRERRERQATAYEQQCREAK